MPRLTQFINSVLREYLQANSSKCRQICRALDRLAARLRGEPPLQLLEALAQEAGFRGVVDSAALEQAAEKNASRLELVHVLEDEDLHLLRPERHIGRTGMAVDCRRIAARERQIVQPVLGEERRMREPRPAPVGVGEKLAVD